MYYYVTFKVLLFFNRNECLELSNDMCRLITKVYSLKCWGIEVFQNAKVEDYWLCICRNKTYILFFIYFILYWCSLPVYQKGAIL